MVVESYLNRSQLHSSLDTRYLNTNSDSVVSGSSQLSYANFNTRGVIELGSNTTQTVALNTVSSTVVEHMQFN